MDNSFQESLRYIRHSGLDTFVTLPPILFAGILDLAHRARQEGAIHIWNAPLAGFDLNDHKLMILLSL